MAPKTAAPLVVVLDETDSTTTPRPAVEAPPPPPRGAAKQWAAADRLEEPEALKSDEISRHRLERKPLEALGTSPKPTAPLPGAGTKKPTTQTIVVRSTDPALVQEAALQVAQRLNGLATRLQTTPDGAMSFLHVEVPATRVPEFKAQFDRQYAMLSDKNLTVAGRAALTASTPAAARSTVGQTSGLREGFTEKRTDALAGAASEGLAKTKELAYGMAGGQTATNPLPTQDQSGPGQQPMVILEIQIKPPAAK
jgi:hypothetical protein